MCDREIVKKKKNGKFLACKCAYYTVQLFANIQLADIDNKQFKKEVTQRFMCRMRTGETKNKNAHIFQLP